MNDYLNATPILDFHDTSIQQLVANQSWNLLSKTEAIKAIYTFVRDEILFGYNLSDTLSAADVLKDGYGQCNTKATLLMALLRAVNIPNRLHGFTIDKALQKGAINGIWYLLSPKNILHSWVEVWVDDQWYYLEGVILDKPYLQALQHKFKNTSGTFCGFGAYTNNLANPPIDWNINHTYIQDLGINQDFGVFHNPDTFYQQHQQALSPIKNWVYRHIVRAMMNKNVAQIRAGISSSKLT